MSVITCKECTKEVSNSVAVCPHCGARLKPRYFMWGCLLIILGGISISGISCLGCMGAVGQAAKESQDRQKAEKQAIIDKLKNGPIENISQEKMKEIFQIGTEFTQVARENALTSIKGKKISWSGEVFEVTRSGNEYKIQLKTTANDIGCFITIEDRSDAQYIENLREGSKIAAVGIVDGMFMRSLVLKPAYLEH